MPACSKACYKKMEWNKLNGEGKKIFGEDLNFIKLKWFDTIYELSQEKGRYIDIKNIEIDSNKI